MIRKLLSILSLCLIAISNLACTCSKSAEFNLVDYDAYACIFEVTVESEFDAKKDTTSKGIPGHSYLYGSGLLNAFTITIHEVFKGDMDLSAKKMHFYNGSSCSWGPEIGSTYIFYADYLHGVEMCNRILIKNYDEKNYEQEKSILRALKSNPSEVHIKLNSNLLIKGRHRQGQRDGVWKIYSPNEKNKLILKLIYKKGMLLDVQKGKAFSNASFRDSISLEFFLEQIKK